MSRSFFMRPEILLGGDSDQEKKKWSSESDLHHLPPLSPVIPTSPRLSRRGERRLHGPRPATPSPNRRGENSYIHILNGKRLAPLSPSCSPNRLSINLDLNTLKEEIVAIEGFRRNSSSPEQLSRAKSPLMRVRSLPSSPVLHRVVRQRNASFKRLNSDSDNCTNSSKEDRIADWIRDVHKYEDNVCVEADDVSSTSGDSSEQDLGSSQLPAIQEHKVYHSRSGLS